MSPQTLPYCEGSPDITREEKGCNPPGIDIDRQYQLPQLSIEYKKALENKIEDNISSQSIPSTTSQSIPSNMAPLRTFLCLLAVSAPIYAEHLKVIFSSGDFSTISGPAGGNTNGHYSGFAIVNDNGDAIYDNGFPDDHSPCYNTDGGRTFTIEGDCWSSPRTFHCEADFGGHPDNCEVKDGDGNSLGTGKGQTDTTFIGISIGQDASCVIEFDSDDTDGGCPKDDGNGPLHVTSG